MNFNYIKSSLADLLFIIVIIWIIFKTVSVINEMIYDKLKIQAFKAQDREIKAYEKLEQMSERLNKAYNIINKYNSLYADNIENNVINDISLNIKSESNNIINNKDSNLQNPNDILNNIINNITA